jgi:hypothetical protein
MQELLKKRTQLPRERYHPAPQMDRRTEDSEMCSPEGKTCLEFWSKHDISPHGCKDWLRGYIESLAR